MTARAREVLRDCERLLAAISLDMPGELWRPRWAGLVALLRSVGHVLREVDAKGSPEAKKVVKAAWGKLVGSRPDPKIFWEFIFDERNNILKTYNFGVRVNMTVRPGGGSSSSEPTTFEAFMRSGPFAGRDALQLCREAIDFWNDHLDSIDRQIAEIAPEPP